MGLTPVSIQHKEFDVKIRGYDKEQVNNFLELVKQEFEQLIKSNKELGKKLALIENKVTQFEGLQNTLNKSIVVAQEAADRLKENAHEEANFILLEAEKSADKLLKESAEKATQLISETAKIRHESNQFKQGVLSLIDSQLNLINNEEWDLLLTTTPECDVQVPTLEEVLMKPSDKIAINQNIQTEPVEVSEQTK